MKKFESLQEAYLYFLGYIMSYGKKIAPRGNLTLEVLNNSFILENPRKRLITLRDRRWSIFYALGEFLWHLSGSDSLASISYYSKSWNKYSENNFSINGSCYGKKLFSNIHGKSKSKWQIAKELIDKNPESRRIVIPLFTNCDLENGEHGKDIACTCFLQFIIRDSKLNLICFMRSNDMFIGFPYDVFVFTMFQELMALETGYNLGWYHHIMTSSHIYDKHWDWASKIISKKSNNDGITMPIMPKNSKFMCDLITYEEQIRIGNLNISNFNCKISDYHESLILCLLYYRALKDKDSSEQKLVIDKIKKYKWLYETINLNSFAIP